MTGMQRIEAELRRILEEEFPDVFLIEMNLKRSGQSVLSISLDTDEGISIDKCAHISRKLNHFLEEEEPFDFPFRLEVSSPGVGRPLLVKRQYTKNVGRKIKVVLENGDLRKGKLIAANETGITVEPSRSKKKKKSQIIPRKSVSAILANCSNFCSQSFEAEKKILSKL